MAVPGRGDRGVVAPRKPVRALRGRVYRLPPFTSLVIVRLSVCKTAKCNSGNGLHSGPILLHYNLIPSHAFIFAGYVTYKPI